MQVSPLPGKTFGALVSGKRLVDFTQQDWEDAYRAFCEYGLLVFPNQFISGKAQADICERFGQTYERLIPTMPDCACVPLGNCHGHTLLADTNSDKCHKDLSAVAEVITDPEGLKTAVQNEYWHVDSTYMPILAKAGTLNAIEVPSGGGETAFADASAAYDALDDQMRRSIDGLQAYHSIQYSKLHDESRDNWGEDLKTPPYGAHGEAYLHKVVKRHPETGRKSICTGRHAFRIEGMDRAASRGLIQKLNAHVVADASRTYAHCWAPGDFGIWDNRRLFHKAMPYDVTQRRLMVAVRITGDASECAEAAPFSKAILQAEMDTIRTERRANVSAKL